MTAFTVQIAEGNMYDRMLAMSHAGNGADGEPSASRNAADDATATGQAGAGPPTPGASAERSAAAQQSEGRDQAQGAGALEPSPGTAEQLPAVQPQQAPARPKAAAAGKSVKRVRFKEEADVIHFEAGPSDDDMDLDGAPAVFRRVDDDLVDLDGLSESSESEGDDSAGGSGEGAGALVGGTSGRSAEASDAGAHAAGASSPEGGATPMEAESGPTHGADVRMVRDQTA